MPNTDTVRHHITHTFIAHEDENPFERVVIETATDDEGPLDDLFDVHVEGTSPIKITRAQLLALADSLRAEL